ncbi:MAG TPA: dienelactone hydrolase family protein, partial [Chitinophagaceae bacterium]
LMYSKIMVCHRLADKHVPQKDVGLFRSQMDSVGIPYTLKIYKSAGNAFTNPASIDLGIKFNMPIAYNRKADFDSWEDMKSFLDTLFSQESPVGTHKCVNVGCNFMGYAVNTRTWRDKFYRT